MSGNMAVAAHLTVGVKRRRAICYFAAAVSGATAMMHFLIGFEVLSVLRSSKDIRL
jgi:hydrogenase-4 membrane subunit HyfE